MIRVLLVAEGASELNGALETLVSRLREEKIEFRTEKMKDPKVKVHLTHGKGAGFTKRALAWLRYAAREKFDALVLLIDQDGERRRQQEIDAAQADQHFPLPRAMGIAIRSFEAWMLADEKALTAVLGRSIDRQPDPESLRHPKAAFNRSAQHVDSDASVLFSRIAAIIDLTLLRSRCPSGFGPFAERVKSL